MKASDHRRLELVAVRTLARVAGVTPVGLGQQALARKYLNRRAWEPGTLETQLVNGARVCLDLGDVTQAKAFLTRRYEPEVVSYIIGRLPRQGTFVDVGASVGLISFGVLTARPGTRIHAFEPDETNYARWRANCALNSAREAHVSLSAIADFVGSGHLAKQQDSGAHHLMDESGGVEVAVTTLDEYAAAKGITRVDVLKVDIEGGEPAALRGAGQLLAERRLTTIVCEMNDVHLKRVGSSREEMVELLVDAGFVPRPLPLLGARKLRASPNAVVADNLAFELVQG